MKRWIAILGFLVLSGAGLVLLRSANSLDTALAKAHPGSTISYRDLAPTTISQGQLIWYEKDGQLHVAWATRSTLGWQVNAWRQVPRAPANGDVAWTVWNPQKAWGLFLAQAAPGITTVRVNDLPANNLPGTGIWWLAMDAPLSPPIEIAGYDPHHRISWQYPSSGQ